MRIPARTCRCPVGSSSTIDPLQEEQQYEAARTHPYTCHIQQPVFDACGGAVCPPNPAEAGAFVGSVHRDKRPDSVVDGEVSRSLSNMLARHVRRPASLRRGRAVSHTLRHFRPLFRPPIGFGGQMIGRLQCRWTVGPVMATKKTSSCG